jgi:hypothetical protein
MRRVLAVLAVLLVVMVGGCSSSEPLAFDLANAMEPAPGVFSVSGAAADEGVVCSEGIFIDSHMENVNGEMIEMSEWAGMLDTAVATQSVAEANSINEYECGDGSGTITITQFVRFDFAELDIETFGQGQVTSGTWTLVGVGDYESLTGSGDLITDFDDGRIHMVGEVEA